MNTKLNPNDITIQSLRKAGYKTRVFHSRYVYYQDIANEGPIIKLPVKPKLFPLSFLRKNKLQHGILAKGGQTVLDIVTPKGDHYEIKAECSLNDSFDRQKALAICTGRLAKILNIQ